MKYKHYSNNLKNQVVKAYLKGVNPKELVLKYNLKSGQQLVYKWKNSIDNNQDIGKNPIKCEVMKMAKKLRKEINNFELEKLKKKTRWTCPEFYVKRTIIRALIETQIILKMI
ncbi:hypothetical protein [Williamsoniiplasma luminosum]|uniref:Transposase n=1 Tax=Williamsoniiplasma luminosum TaxID=214888 RepID=A0A2S0NJ15_9MOLU|nr:hypothetical protein [Williamsoniiplasma luminosum]AVP49010.1 MAG: hypothetical protein C5T88_00190 [Williamsoniiplasma luminosum]